MAEKIRLTKTGITAPMFCEPAAVDYWVNERGWVIDPTDQVPGPPGSQPVTRDDLAAFGLATGKTAVAIPTGTTAPVGGVSALLKTGTGFELAPSSISLDPADPGVLLFTYVDPFVNNLVSSTVGELV